MTMLLPPAAPPPVSAPPAAPPKLDPFAALLSYLVPGLGQIYQGRVGKGLLFMVCLYLLFFYLRGEFACRFEHESSQGAALAEPGYNG